MADHKKSVEALKIFPIIAWGTMILFAIFVYNLAVELRAATENLERSTELLQAQIGKDPNDIDFHEFE